MQIPRNLGKYQIGQPVGRGGMGFVYRGEDQLVGRPVAIKFLRPDLLGADPKKRHRFAIEAKTAARLLHPNLVTIFDVGEYLEIPYIVTQFVEGRSLRDRIMSGDLSATEKLEIFHDIASALVVCHAAGIVHRDIKPSNVRLSGDGRAVLLDFGIAKVSEEPEVTRVGVVVGSAPYMSPEQARGEVVDGRSDLFSLGAMMYQGYAGRKPFDGPSRREVILLRQRLRAEDLPPSLTRDGVPEEIDWIVRRLLQPNQERRYPSARALVADLDAVRSALSATGARAGERLTLRTQLAPGAGRAWVTPALVSALLLVAGLVGLMVTRGGASEGPERPPIVHRPPDPAEPPAPTADESDRAAWHALLDGLARGETDFGTVLNLARQPQATARRKAAARSLARGAEAEALVKTQPRQAYDAYRKMTADPTVPARIARAAEQRATALLADRQRRLAGLEDAIRLLLGGRFAAARSALDTWAATATSRERGQVRQLRHAIRLVADAHVAVGSEDPSRARPLLIELAAVGPPECLDLALHLLDRLDARLAAFGAVCARRLERATRLAKAGVPDEARALLAQIPPGSVDPGARAELQRLLEANAGPAARQAGFRRWRQTASDLLTRGDFTGYGSHREGAFVRFKGIEEAPRIIAALDSQREAAERDAQMTFNRYQQFLRRAKHDSARGLLEVLRNKYPRCRWTRIASNLWDTRSP